MDVAKRAVWGTGETEYHPHLICNICPQTKRTALFQCSERNLIELSKVFYEQNCRSHEPYCGRHDANSLLFTRHRFLSYVFFPKETEDYVLPKHPTRWFWRLRNSQGLFKSRFGCWCYRAEDEKYSPCYQTCRLGLWLQWPARNCSRHIPRGYGDKTAQLFSCAESQLITYLAILRELRIRAKKTNAATQGFYTDGYLYRFMSIDADGEIWESQI